MFNFTCLDSCPPDYEPDENKTCVAAHEICHYGYKWNNISCVLDVAECKSGYVLNKNNNKCMPVPGF